MPQRPVLRNLRNDALHISAGNAPSSVTDARILKTDAALRDALLEMLDEMPLHEITVRDVCKRASVHYTTFYRRFGTKESLIDYIAADQIDTVVRITVPIVDNVDSISGFMALFSYVKSYKTLWNSLLTGGAAPMMRSLFLKSAQDLSPDRVQKGGFVPTELARICTVNIILDCITWWVGQRNEKYSVSTIANIANTLVQSCIPHNTLFK